MEHQPLANIFQDTIERLLSIELQIKERNANALSEHIMNLEHFWEEIDVISKKLSFECTKLCIAFSGSPLPSSLGTSALLEGVEQAILALVSNVLQVNSSCGKTLYEKINESTIEAIQSTRKLIRIIKDDGGTGINDRYRQATGIVWEGCRMLENCPKNNKEAVLAIIKDQGSLVTDAFEEINEALEGDGKGMFSLGLSSSDNEEDEEEEPSWSDKDKLIVDPAVNIIKAAKILYSKLLVAIEKNGCCESCKQTQELDKLLEDCNAISMKIDALVLELYPPLNTANVDLQGHALASNLLASLKTAANSHIITEDLQPTVDFLQKAINHNLDKMKNVLKNL